MPRMHGKSLVILARGEVADRLGQVGFGADGELFAIIVGVGQTKRGGR